MSELNKIMGMVCERERMYYNAAKVDAILAKKDNEIAELKAQKAQAEDDCAYWKMCHGNAEKAMHETEEACMHLTLSERHSNHKRCLAMAKWCFEKSYSTTLVKYDEKSGLLRNFYDWWGKRWLELAEEPTWEKFLQLIHKEEK